MKRLLIYSLVVLISYIAGLFFYRAAFYCLGIPTDSEYDLLNTGLSLFFIFVAVPSYIWISLLLLHFKSRSFVFDTLAFILFGFFPATMVPFMIGFGFGYLTLSSYFFSDMAILLYAFFTGTGLFFSIGSSAAKMYIKKSHS
ncbi:hypothetical protein GK047_10140 [Paenibacillus sp. SYP-B3998]|uniref:Uncharacterized protein n=1 Tax=Paenibacillus sp. SYP-B3998 TaxID=2678564 RepID=A0A6G3ZWB8_9BACL|nr:hypothetical protein [Paenibacillus sp. SYP-B3998]NEW06370.1 hypothetical protein [Paenibacillus sp. SYP-B3998]